MVRRRGGPQADGWDEWGGAKEQEWGNGMEDTTVDQNNNENNIEKPGAGEGEKVKKGGGLTMLSRSREPKKASSAFKFHVITGRALKDIFTLRRIIVYLVILLAVPVITSFFMSSKISSYPIDMQVVKLTDYLFVLSYLWIAGIPLVFMSAGTISSIVTAERTQGTMLQLVTKPLRRWEIIIGKFLAFFILFAFVEILAFLLSIYLMIYFSGCHMSVFPSMLAFLPPLLLYSFIVSIFFGSIALLLSTALKKTAHTILIIAFLVMFFYIGFLFFRLLGTNTYLKFYLNYLDIGYILGNVYISLLQGFSVDLSPNFQLIFGFTAGTYDPAAFMDTLDPDQGFQLTTLPANNYVSAPFSMILSLLLPVAFIVLSVLRIGKMEVS